MPLIVETKNDTIYSSDKEDSESKSGRSSDSSQGYNWIKPTEKIQLPGEKCMYIY